jgi:hypothetical protein
MSTAAFANSRYKVGMTETSEEKPDKPARRPAQRQPSARQPTASEAERLERQAEALRANLRRRKEQSRGRDSGPDRADDT